VLGARWEEFDLDAALWEIPTSRMKGKRKHLVPLSNRARQIVEYAKDA
jgi:integrase